MPPLAAQLNVQANLDLTDLFEGLASEVLDVDFGDATFDAAGVLNLVSGASGPDLSMLQTAVQGALTSGSGRLDLGIPGVTVPPALLDLLTRLGSLQAITLDVATPDAAGLPALGLRIDAVRASVESGALADLLAVVPGLEWPSQLGRLGGDLAGLVDLLSVLAGLTATAATSRHLAERTERFAALLDPDAAADSAALLLDLSADLDLVTSIRGADPSDADVVEALAVRVAAFEDAIALMSRTWSAGMGYGEAALPLVDIAGSAAAIEAARRALAGADVEAVARLVAEIRRIAAPLLDAPLPDPAAFGAGFVAQAAELVNGVTSSVEDWDVTAALHPITDVTALAIAPITSFQQALAGVENEMTGALRALRGLVDELDLTPLAVAVHDAIQPVVDLLDAVEVQIASAQASIEEVASRITAALDQVADLVSSAASDVTAALESVNGALDELHLQDLADTLTTALRTVASELSSAQLSPYFDAAIDVIGTAADIIDQVPFGMLPTDVQQEIVDACKPIKELDLQDVEDTLREQLASIRGAFAADALAGIEAAYADVVSFLQGLDPQPHLAGFESGALAEVRAALDGIDPEALLAPLDTALGEIRGLLAGVDLEREVLEPLRGLFTPILDAMDELDPVTILAPVRAQVDELRASITDLLHLDAAEEALTSFRERVVGMLDRIDPAGVANALDDRAIAAISALPDGPPGGAFGSILVSLAEASGLRADEGAVQDVIGWVRGDAVGGDVVRARLQASAGRLVTVRDAVASLDPRAVAAAAVAHQRALTGAVAAHPADSLLRSSLEPMLTESSAAEVLGSLEENRRRYQVRLDVDAGIANGLAASARGEVTEAAARLRVALAPLGAFPARLRELLAAVGLDPEGRSLRAVLLDLLSAAGPGGLASALTALVLAARAKVVEAVDVVVGSATSAVESVRGVIDQLDIAPIVAELEALHAEVRDEVAQLTPDALLGDVVAEADAVIQRLEDFDPLAPVRQVVTEARQAADAVFESARPTVVFAPVVELHRSVVGIASGLDVVTLLRPILDALDGIAAQLDDGLDRTGDALIDLQAALPSEVSSTDLGVSASVGVGVSF